MQGWERQSSGGCSGHPRWLFSCSLYIHPLPRTRFTYTLLTWLTLTYLPLPQLVIVLALAQNSPMLIKGLVRGVQLAGFHGNQCANLISISPTGNFPMLQGARMATMFCPQPGCQQHMVVVGCCFRTCFRHVSSPKVLNHWCLCHWCPACSLVLELGKDRPDRPAGCRPTGGFPRSAETSSV